MSGGADLAEAARRGYEARKRHRVLSDGELARLAAAGAFAEAADACDAVSAELDRLSGPDSDRGPARNRAYDARLRAGSERYTADKALGDAARAAYGKAEGG